MTFRDENKLDQHIKYSSLHLSAVENAKKETANAANVDGGVNTKEIVPNKQASAGTAVPTPITADSVKHIYSGSKYFWRSADTVELDIFLHQVLWTVEIVGSITSKQLSLPRIYLDYTSMEGAISLEAARVADEKQKNSELTFEALLAENKRTILATEIIKRCQLTTINASGAPTEGRVSQSCCGALSPGSQVLTFNRFSSDRGADTVLERPPADLLQMEVQMKFHASIGEMQAKLAALQADTEQLVASTAKAERMLKEMAVAGFAMAKKRKHENLTFWQAKWKWACHRVVLLNAIAANTVILKRIYGEDSVWAGNITLSDDEEEEEDATEIRSAAPTQ
jgi:hypothetical protein